MTLVFKDRNQKVVLHSWGRFRATMFEDVVVGDLLTLKSDTEAYSLQLANDAGGEGAIAVAVENILAGKTGWCALAAELKAPTTLGTGGVITQQYFDDGTDIDIGQPLYLDAEGKCDETIGTSLPQRVGYNVARDRILLVPGGSITGEAGNFTTLDATGIVSIDGRLTLGDDLYLASGKVINFDTGDVTITHSSGKLVFLATVTAPAMSDGIGVFEFNGDISTSPTGHFAASSSWVNIATGVTLPAALNIYAARSDGIYQDAGGAISGGALIFGARMQAIMGDTSGWDLLCPWSINTNIAITALIHAANPVVDLAQVTNAGADAGTLVPFHVDNAGTKLYVKMYALV